jgi:biotin-dependent carboxylase-like uncharacterized protein
MAEQVDRGIVVIDGGPLTTVQDLGRRGWAHLGVPRSGALDEPALRLANRLVGNPETAAALETTLAGVVFRPERDTALAVTGASCDVRVAGRAVGWGTAVTARAGVEVRIGAAVRGLRSYVALAGGVDVVPVLGSRSTDLLSGLGPPPLRAGDRVPLGPPPVGSRSGAEATPPGVGNTVRVRLGPRADWFSAAALARLDASTYEVGAASNRIGLRLVGPALARLVEDELPSEGMVLGALQVPPNGQPVILLNDHPTTGGYPVVAVVVGADLPVCAQARPGDRLTLRVVGRRGEGAAQDPRPRG